MSTDRAVIYVESGTNLAGLGSLRGSPGDKSAPGGQGHTNGGSNYVIKIQIGEETIFNPVRIDVSAGKVTRAISSKESPIGSDDSTLGSSGQSSPRSDMTPPPRINAGANRFGSETSESDTESDVSAEFRPLACPAAQFALREICEAETTSPPMPRSIMKKPGGQNPPKVPPLPSTATGPQQQLSFVTPKKEFMSLVGITNHVIHQKLAQRNSDPTLDAIVAINKDMNSARNNLGSTPPPSKIIGKIMSLSEATGKKLMVVAKERGNSIIVDQNGFHVNEINGMTGKPVINESEESLSNFAGYKDIFSRTNRDGTKQILSDKGTIRGVKNRVRDGIATFLQTKDTKTYNEKEQGRVVVYVTSMGVVRDTFQRCHKVKQILRNLLVKFDERDCYMNRAIQNEIRQRLPQQQLALPHVFLEGQHLGDAEVIEKLNETGELRDLLKPYKSLSVLNTCERCGGFRMLPCAICNGSKKSVHRNHFTTEFIALKCMHCDPSGLVRCDLCNAPDS